MAELNAAPEQAVIQSPMPDNGFDVLSTIFKDPVKPSELKRDVDPAKVKEALGKQFDDGSDDKTPEQKTKDDEAEFTKEFEKKDEPEEKKEPEAKKEDSKPEDKKEENPAKDPAKVAESDDEETEAKGKIKNIGDARKLYKEHKKLKKESAEKLSAAEEKLKAAEDKLAALEAAPKPDAEKIAAQEKLVAEFQAKEKYLAEQFEIIEQKTNAFAVQDSEPFKRLVTKPLERMGADLEELASAVSDEQGDQVAFMQAVGRVLSIDDPKARRKALEEVGAPLTSMQQAELIKLAKDHKGVMQDKAKLLEDSAKTKEIIQQKEDMDRRERSVKTTSEFQQGAKEAREEMKKKYKFFERTDLPPEFQNRINELEAAVDKIDPAKLPAKEVGKIVEAFYRGQILNDAASQHIAHMEKAEQKYKSDLEAALAKIAAFEKAQKDGKAKEEAVDGARPNLDSGGTNSDTGARVDTIEGMVSNLFKV